MNNTNTLPHSWLTSDLMQKVREVFEPRYKRKLTDEEVIEIAENLTGVMEVFLKMKWRQRMEKKTK